ncbi:MAG: hypothetical protein ACKO58_05715 [Cyanobium sp.]
MPTYTSDEFRAKFAAGLLETVPVKCWILGLEADAYVVSFEPVNCTGDTKVPFSLVDQVELIGFRRCRGNGGDMLTLPRVRLFLKKPDSAEGAVLFALLRDLGIGKESCGCKGTQESTSAELDDATDALKNLCGSVLGSEVQCNLMSGPGDCNSTERCRRAFRFMKDFRDEPNRDTVQALADYINGSDFNKKCMRRIFEVADADFGKILALIGEILG